MSAVNRVSDGFRGNQYTDLVRGKNYPVPTSHATAIKIADENGISEKSVRLFGEYTKGVDVAEKIRTLRWLRFGAKNITKEHLAPKWLHIGAKNEFRGKSIIKTAFSLPTF